MRAFEAALFRRGGPPANPVHQALVRGVLRECQAVLVVIGLEGAVGGDLCVLAGRLRERCVASVASAALKKLRKMSHPRPSESKPESQAVDA